MLKNLKTWHGILAPLHVVKSLVICSAMDTLLNQYELKICFVHYTQSQKKVTPIFLRSCDYDNQAQLFETDNSAFMKIFDFLVKTALLGAFLLFLDDFCHKLQPKIKLGG